MTYEEMNELAKEQAGKIEINQSDTEIHHVLDKAVFRGDGFSFSGNGRERTEAGQC